MFKYITLPSGNQIRVFDTQEGGPAVVFLHGLSNSIEIWERVVAELSPDFRILAFDLPGFGQSDRPDAAYDSRFYINELLGFLDIMRLEKPHLVGNSLGGGIVVRFAARYPERVDKAVIAAPGGFGQETNFSMRLLAFPWLGYLLAKPSRLSMSMTLRMCIHQKEHRTTELHDLMVKYGLAQGGHRAFYRALRSGVGLSGVIGRDAFEEAACNMLCPTLVLWGVEDKVFPHHQSDNALSFLPHATRVSFERCGHYPQWERPKAFSKVVATHLRGEAQQTEVR